MSGVDGSELRLRLLIFMSVLVSLVSFIVSWSIFLDMPKSREFSYIATLDIIPLLLFGFLMAAMLIPSIAQDILAYTSFKSGVILTLTLCIADAAIAGWYVFGGISPTVSFDKLGIDPHILSYMQLLKILLVLIIVALGCMALKVYNFFVKKMS